MLCKYIWARLFHILLFSKKTSIRIHMHRENQVPVTVLRELGDWHDICFLIKLAPSPYYAPLHNTAHPPTVQFFEPLGPSYGQAIPHQDILTMGT